MSSINGQGNPGANAKAVAFTTPTQTLYVVGLIIFYKKEKYFCF
jgi:hypothetical protein